MNTWIEGNYGANESTPLWRECSYNYIIVLDPEMHRTWSRKPYIKKKLFYRQYMRLTLLLLYCTCGVQILMLIWVKICRVFFFTFSRWLGSRESKHLWDGISDFFFFFFMWKEKKIFLLIIVIAGQCHDIIVWYWEGNAWGICL